MKNRRIKHFVGAFALAVMLSSAGGIAHGAEAFPQLMDGVTEKSVGDRFSITEFNDIWRFIRGIFVGDNDTPLDATDDYRYGLGAEPRIIDSQNVTLDLGAHATIPGVLAADQICDDTSCSSVTSVLNATAGGGVGTFVGLTTATSDGDMGGYAGANALCDADYSGSHMCADTEILATISGGSLTGWDTLADGWMSTGNGKFPTTEETNDCNGWTHNTSGQYFGNFWNFDLTGGIGKSSYCQQQIRLACCTN